MAVMVVRPADLPTPFFNVLVVSTTFQYGLEMGQVKKRFDG
jgi:hypothetical protein